MKRSVWIAGAGIDPISKQPRYVALDGSTTTDPASAQRFWSIVRAITASRRYIPSDLSAEVFALEYVEECKSQGRQPVPLNVNEALDN